MVMLTLLSRPGPRPDLGLMPTSLAIGPFTTNMGAWALVDIRRDLPPCGPSSDNALTAAMMTGICSGFAPAIAAFMAMAGESFEKTLCRSVALILSVKLAVSNENAYSAFIS